MSAIPLNKVQAKLPELIHALAPGEQMTITENGSPITQLVSVQSPPPRRKLGSMRGTVIYMAPDFDDPLAG
ncbi:MAG: type II toxin-antitoxin system prevent-host-death family antitoxin [Pirellulaceae bacterium]|nr:type II toxin-antitoxin system prevent-host-death family antitoxin [Pirellulaceae bacterium]